MERLLDFLDKILYREESEEIHLLERKKTKGKIPVNDVSILSYVFISWMTPLIRRIYKRRHEQIREDDIWQCSDKETVDCNIDRLEEIWGEELQSYGQKASSFLRVWLRFTQTRLLISVFVLIVNIILTFILSGFVTGLIVSYLESDDSNIMYVAGILIGNFVGQILRACTFGFLYLFGGQTGIRFRAAVVGLAYKKILKLKTLKGDTFSEIITIFGSDSLKVFMNCQMCIFFIAAPLYLVIGAGCSYYFIGSWCFVAIGIYAFVYQLQAVFSTYTTRLQRRTMKWTDKRIRMLKELLSSMKMIKMYAWEDAFKESIVRVRSRETSVLRKLSVLTNICYGMAPATQTLSSVATLAAYASYGNKLQASTAFSVLSTLNAMGTMILMLPVSTRAFGETRVCFERIKRLLLKEEYQGPGRDITDKTFAVEIKDGVFGWDVDSVSKKSDGAVGEQCCGAENQLSLDDGKRLEATCSLKLNGINLTIQKGHLVGLCGTVGCGKSSLVSAILGRMPILSGHLAVGGSVAYSSQQAWIFNGTLKENVVFGSTYDPVWYKRVIYACGLQPDLELLANGDETEIGDKGINISGGQKQRISLARAVYSKCDIYLLDDPLSAVDVHVGKHLFQKCIAKLLRTKTVILVTHQLQYLKYCNDVIVMGDGQIVEQGTPSNLFARKGKYMAMMEQLNLTMSNKNTSDETLTEQHQSSTEENLCSDRNWTKSKIDIPTPGKGNLTEKEKVETGSIHFNAYKTYIDAAGGIYVFIVVLLLYLISMGSPVFSEWWLGIWIQQTTTQMSEAAALYKNISTTTSLWNTSFASVNDTSTASLELPEEVDFYIFIYIGSVVIMLLFTVIRSVVAGVVFIRASRRIHNRALARVIKSPMSYFDGNPPGRILNRFSSDIDEGDVYIPCFMDLTLQMMLTVALSLISAAITLPCFLIVLVPALIICFVLGNISAVSIRQLKRYENICRSPLLNHVATTGQGLSTIVSYKQQSTYMDKCMEYIDMTSTALLLLDGSKRWTSLKFDLMGSLLAASAAVFVVFTEKMIPVPLAALALSLCIKVTTVMLFLIRMANELESRFTSIERIHEYERLEIEKDIPTVRPDLTWPSEGHITFSNVVMKYRNDMDPVLRDINLDIPQKQKYGIIGRTGAGKSSLATVLFRLVDLCSGHIYIDGVDIGVIPRNQLRSKLSVIPQDPVLFAGTLRYNLDPFGKHSDSDLWSVLEQVHIKEKMKQFDIDLDQNIEENGENFSVGERQLICLARAILRRNKILILDEATASIDKTTESMIQNTIRESFADCTVLTIAHRLSTVFHCDAILVMQAGQVVETGKPQELMLNQSSHFSKMVHSQTVQSPPVH